MNQSFAEEFASLATSAWIEQLSHLMLPWERVELSPRDRDVLFDHARGARNPIGYSQELRDDLKQLLTEFPEGAHLRLEGCSLRKAERVPRILSADQALTALSQSNGRVAACQRLLAPFLAEQSLFLFQWADIPTTHEFRIFVIDKVIQGITPYHGARAFDQQIYNKLGEVEAVLFNIGAEIASLTSQPTFAADVFLDASHKPVLIELNPLGPTTGTGLFDQDFDGQLRYPAPQYQQPQDSWRI